MMDLLPRGALLPIVGGLLIGAGIGSFLTALQSRWSRRACFRRAWVLGDLRWKTFSSRD